MRRLQGQLHSDNWDENLNNEQHVYGVIFTSLLDNSLNVDACLSVATGYANKTEEKNTLKKCMPYYL